MKRREKKTALITVRLQPSTKEALEKTARENYRTLAQEVEMRLIKSLEREGKDPLPID